jgi:hypothetical protein
MSMEAGVQCGCMNCGEVAMVPASQLGQQMICPSCGQLGQFGSPKTHSHASLAPPASVGGETTFFNENGIAVTKTRFVAGVQTFAMSGITSVRMAKTDPSMGSGVILILLGALCILVGLALAFQTILGALFVASIGVPLIYSGSKVESRRQPTFHVILNTSGGEVTAYTSKDVDFVMRLPADACESVQRLM